MSRKALLIGINYVGSKNELQGCHQDVANMKDFLLSRGFDESDMVVLTDSPYVNPQSPAFPTGQNILRAFNWLTSNSNGCSLFLHYSGHGGQVADPQGSGGLDDTLVPVDFEYNGQIDADIIHRYLVSQLPDDCQLHAIFDCCHSGSAMELPFVYRTDDEGNVNMVDNIKQGIQLASAAASLLNGGFTMQKVQDAEQLYAGATSFFKSLKHMGGGQEQEGLGESESAGRHEYIRGENKRVFLFSGCRDDQTSADASISGSHVGAMSWAFLENMKSDDGSQSYVQILQNTRGLLRQNYSQVPQLSTGQQIDLNVPFSI